MSHRSERDQIERLQAEVRRLEQSLSVLDERVRAVRASADDEERTTQLARRLLAEKLHAIDEQRAEIEMLDGLRDSNSRLILLGGLGALLVFMGLGPWSLVWVPFGAGIVASAVNARRLARCLGERERRRVRDETVGQARHRLALPLPIEAPQTAELVALSRHVTALGAGLVARESLLEHDATRKLAAPRDAERLERLSRDADDVLRTLAILREGAETRHAARIKEMKDRPLDP